MEGISSENEYLIQTPWTGHKKEEVSFLVHSTCTLYIGKLIARSFLYATKQLWERSNEKVETQGIFVIQKNSKPNTERHFLHNHHSA